MADGPTDPRFILANERTLLAYIRTSLALQVAGLGVLQFLTSGHQVLRDVLGLVFILVGSYVGGAGYLRHRANDAAIRSGQDVRTAVVPAVAVVAIIAVPVVAGLVIVLS